MSNWDGTTYTFVDDAVLTYTQLNTYTQTPLAALGDSWTSFTPAWTAVTTDPAIGNGSSAGMYKRLGKMLFFQMSITMGSTTTYGSGAWRLNIPGGYTAVSGPMQCGPAQALDDTTRRYPGTWYCESGSGIINRIAFHDAALGASSLSPHTWATGDVLIVGGFLIIA